MSTDLRSALDTYRNRLDETGLLGAPSTLDGWDA